MLTTSPSWIGVEQSFSLSLLPRRNKITRPYPRPPFLRLNFLRDVSGAGPGKCVAVKNEPSIEVCSVFEPANAPSLSSSKIASVYGCTGNDLRVNPLTEGLECLKATWTALLFTSARLSQFGGINAPKTNPHHAYYQSVSPSTHLRQSTYTSDATAWDVDKDRRNPATRIKSILVELCQALGVSCSLVSVWRALRRVGITLKKCCTPRNRPGLMSSLRISAGAPPRSPWPPHGWSSLMRVGLPRT